MNDENLGSLTDIYVIQANGKKALAVTGGGQPLDVLLQNNIAPIVIAKFNQVQQGTTLAEVTLKEDVTITVVDPTGFAVGQYLVMYSTEIDRYFLAYILDVVGSEITVDTPLDAEFPVGSIVGGAITNMAINGSVDSQIFGLRGNPVENPLNLVFDITRILFRCETVDSPDLSTFADIAGGITKGLILRKRNGEFNNIFNVKTNGDLSSIMFDFKIELATNPAQGQNGFTGRLTFSGQDKIGTVVRLAEGEDLEFIVQDDLSTITKLEAIAEGHVVVE